MSARRLVVLALLAVGLLLVLIFVGPRAWKTRGDSMLPGTRPEERVLTVNARITGLAPGDLVIARIEGVDVLKRVAAVGPAVVDIDQHGLLPSAQRFRCRDGAFGCARETLGIHVYEVRGVTTAPARYSVPAGHVFLLGDARGQSRDSRAYGSVSRRQLRGVAVWR